ncbi:MAG: thiamine phosphate synthase [Blastocatellia bacterium]|nr:thiamine phosphate synthase [Blastocatellia bacterium]
MGLANRSKPLVYLITDRRTLQTPTSEHDLSYLLAFIERALSGGVDLIQIRERDLAARDLFSLTETAARIAEPYDARILINDRADIAAAAGVGVHLTTRSLRPETVREAFGPDILIGASTHSLEEATEAESSGADFIVFGPVFETESKKIYGPPVGLESLGEVAGELSIPVLALGGIKLSNFARALDRGAAGIAAISLFTEADDIEAVVRKIKVMRGAF